MKKAKVYPKSKPYVRGMHAEQKPRKIGVAKGYGPLHAENSAEGETVDLAKVPVLKLQGGTPNALEGQPLKLRERAGETEEDRLVKYLLEKRREKEELRKAGLGEKPDNRIRLAKGEGDVGGGGYRFRTVGSNFGEHGEAANYHMGVRLQDWQVSTNDYPLGTWLYIDNKWYQVADPSFHGKEKLTGGIEFRDYDHGNRGKVQRVGPKTNWQNNAVYKPPRGVFQGEQKRYGDTGMRSGQVQRQMEGLEYRPETYGGGQRYDPSVREPVGPGPTPYPSGGGQQLVPGSAPGGLASGASGYATLPGVYTGELGGPGDPGRDAAAPAADLGQGEGGGQQEGGGANFDQYGRPTFEGTTAGPGGQQLAYQTTSYYDPQYGWVPHAQLANAQASTNFGDYMRAGFAPSNVSGSGGPTQRGVGMAVGTLSNLFFPGLGFVTGPIARMVTKMIQGGATPQQVQAAVAARKGGTEDQGGEPAMPSGSVNLPTTPRGYGSAPSPTGQTPVGREYWSGDFGRGLESGFAGRGPGDYNLAGPGGEHGAFGTGFGVGHVGNLGTAIGLGGSYGGGGPVGVGALGGGHWETAHPGTGLGYRYAAPTLTDAWMGHAGFLESQGFGPTMMAGAAIPGTWHAPGTVGSSTGPGGAAYGGSRITGAGLGGRPVGGGATSRHMGQRLTARKGKTRVPNTDTVPAMLTPHEAVLNRNAAELAGRGNIEKLNAEGNKLAEKGVDLAGGGKNMKPKVKKYQAGTCAIDPYSQFTKPQIGGPQPATQLPPGGLPGPQPVPAGLPPYGSRPNPVPRGMPQPPQRPSLPPGPFTPPGTPPSLFDEQWQRGMALHNAGPGAGPVQPYANTNQTAFNNWAAAAGAPGFNTMPEPPPRTPATNTLNPAAFRNRLRGMQSRSFFPQSEVPPRLPGFQGGANDVQQIGEPQKGADWQYVQFSAPQLQAMQKNLQQQGLNKDQISSIMGAFKGAGGSGGGMDYYGEGSSVSNALGPALEAADAAGYQGGISDIGYPPFVAPTAVYHKDSGGWQGSYDPNYMIPWRG